MYKLSVVQHIYLFVYAFLFLAFCSLRAMFSNIDGKKIQQKTKMGLKIVFDIC